jgi:hypothetical protein
MSAPIFLASFAEEHAILGATRDARAAGFTVHDVYTPYPVHGMDDAMGLSPSRLTWVCFFAGLTGLAIGYVVQWWASAIDWPLNIGGKPFNSIPAFVPVMFELMVLIGGLTTVGALFLRSRLRPRLAPPPEVVPRATNDRFVLALVTRDRFNEVEARALCKRHGAVEARLAGGAR